jgi:hypothetical protein
MTNDKFHTHNTRSSLAYNKYVHKLGIHNSRPTIAGGNLVTNSLHASNRLKLSVSLRVNLSSF